MLMYNLIEYDDNYSMTSVSFWSYYRDEINDDDAYIKINNNKTITSKSFENKTKLIGSTPDNNNTLDTEVVFH